MQILVKAKDSNTWRRGDIIHILRPGEQWGRKESYSKFLAEGGHPRDWPGTFVIIDIPDTPIPLDEQAPDRKATHKIDLDSISIDNKKRGAVPDLSKITTRNLAVLAY